MQEVNNQEIDSDDEEENAKNGGGAVKGATMNPAFVIDDSDIPSRETSCEREVA